MKTETDLPRKELSDARKKAEKIVEHGLGGWTWTTHGNLIGAIAAALEEKDREIRDLKLVICDRFGWRVKPQPCEWWLCPMCRIAHTTRDFAAHCHATQSEPIHVREVEETNQKGK